MHPALLSTITMAQIADRHRQAERHAIARAARRAHDRPAPQRLGRAAALTRHVSSGSVPICPPAITCTSCT